MKQYMLIKEDIISTLDDYINDVQVLDNTVDTGTKTLRTVVKISINDVALDAKLSLTSAAGGTGASQGSTIVAYYINRETGSRKTYKAKSLFNLIKSYIFIVFVIFTIYPYLLLLELFYLL